MARVLVPREPAIDLVKILSEGTYTSFPQALKEFVSNAYDADATRVDIGLDEDCSSLVIRDNGVGMTVQDFRDHFASIARPGKAGARSVHGRTSLGRPKIGRFGIGSLAIVGAASEFSVRSVRKGIGRGFEAHIDLKALRAKFDQGEDLSEHWKFECREWDNESPNTRFTEIRIGGIREDIRQQLNRLGTKTSSEFYESTRQLSGIEELTWRLGMVCPVSYAGGYPVDQRVLDPRRERLIVSRVRKILKSNFALYLNGRPVRREVNLPRYHPNKLVEPQEAQLLSTRGLGFEVLAVKSAKGSPVRFDGYLVVQAMQLFPQELRGILIRLRGVGIGWHSTLNITAAGLSTMMPCLSGEIWVEGMEDALQFDRESFREDHPKYIILQKQLEAIVRQEATRFRQRSAARLRALGRHRRKKGGAKKKVQVSASVQNPVVAPVPPLGAAPTLVGTIVEEFLPAEVFDAEPEYIKRLVPQINGSWERAYYEACAMVLRRLAETLIIQLYFKRGWEKDVKHPKIGDYFTLNGLINKVCGDQRIGLESRAQQGLQKIKGLGDIAAHDFRVKVRRFDLETIRSDVRFTFERLLFRIRGIGP